MENLEPKEECSDLLPFPLLWGGVYCPLCFLGGASGEEPACQGGRPKRHRVDPWVGNIPWRKAWQFTPVFLENPMD